MSQPDNKADQSATFCILPWIHQYIGPPGDVKPCCVYEQDMKLGDFKKDSLSTIFNNAESKQLRLDLLNGVIAPGCAKCNIRVNLISTPRSEFNVLFLNEETHKLVNSTREDGSLEHFRLQYLDMRFNNLCNFRCRTCGPRFSTTWIDDIVRLFNIPKDKLIEHDAVFQFPGKTQNALFEELRPQLPYIKQIYFAGGEPLITENHYQVLEELIRLGRHNDPPLALRINYNTNLSQLKLKQYNVLDFWKQFNNVRVDASIDGSYARAEYWRKGTVWADIVNNRKAILEQCPNVEFGISSTMSWVNALNLIDLHKEWIELGLLDSRTTSFVVNQLDVPSYYSLKAVPIQKKQQIEKALLEHIDWMIEHNLETFVINKFKNAITFMYNSDSSNKFVESKQFLERNNRLDIIRNECFWDVFPEHNDIKKLLKEK